MTTTFRIFLSISVFGLVLSITGILWGFCLPIAVICLGLCMILKITSKEIALFDEEQRERLQRAAQASPAQLQSREESPPDRIPSSPPEHAYPR